MSIKGKAYVMGAYDGPNDIAANNAGERVSAVAGDFTTSEFPQGVDVVDGVRAQPLPTGAHDVRWVRLDGLHLTLRFLGPTADAQLGPTIEAMDRVTAGNTTSIVFPARTWFSNWPLQATR
mgnify:CR=1 FL=1